jgi:AraC-like DNA-binding protein
MIGQITRYFNSTQRDRRWGFQVTGAGHAFVEVKAAYPPGAHPENYNFNWERGRRLEEFALLYLTGGEGIFESTHKKATTLRAGDAAILFPHEWHRYRPEEKTGWEEYWVTFSGSIPQKWRKEKFLDPRHPLFTDVGLSLAPTFDELLRLVTRSGPKDDFIMTGLCHVLLGRLLAAPKSRRDSRDKRILDAADYLRLHANEPVDLPELAQRLGMSYSSFRRLFAQYFDVAPHQFHQQARIAFAKELLQSTDLPLKSIAERLSYPSEFYLMQVFKRHTGQTPTHWRKALPVGERD